MNRAELDQLCNPMIDRNEKTLPNTFLIIFDFPNYINKTEGSWCLESYNQDSISSHHLQLNQYQSLDKLASFHFNELKLEHECDPDLQFSDSVPNFKSRLTPVTLSDLDHLLEPTLNPVYKS